MRARAKTIDTTRHTRTRDLKPQARIRTRPKPCTRACAAPSPASASVSICRERLGLVQDFDSQCSFIVPDHEDPIRHLRQGATQLVLCRVCNLRARVLPPSFSSFLVGHRSWFAQNLKPQRRERSSCRRRRRQPIHHVRKNKTQLVFLDVCEVGPQLSDFSSLASQGVAALLLILSCSSATMLIAKVTQGGDLFLTVYALGAMPPREMTPGPRRHLSWQKAKSTSSQDAIMDQP